jgi:histidine triad (HIT) family protein
MLRVLFICEGNRARSQLAEAMLRHHGAGRFEVFSAGIRPGDEVPSFTIDALNEAHYPSHGLRSKHFSEFADEELDFLIVLCDTVRSEVPDLPRARTRLDWPVEDPGDAMKRGVPVEEALRSSRHDLRSRIVRFMEAQGCIFCAILQGTADASFVYRDDNIAAFMDVRPVNEGHVLVIPNEHHVTIDEVPAPIAGRMTAVAARIARALQKSDVRMEGYNLFIANGEAAGQEVFHVHLHIIPRFPRDGFGFRFPEGYGALTSRPNLDDLAGRIKRQMRAKSQAPKQPPKANNT